MKREIIEITRIATRSRTASFALALVFGWLFQTLDAASARELEFNEQHALGSVYSRLPPAEDAYYFSTAWNYIGLARGNVEIPADHEVQLEISRAGLKHLHDLRRLGSNDLQFLNLRDLNITDDALTNVLHLKGLRAIRLSGNPITDQGVGLLTNFPQLIYINLSDTPVADRGIADIARLGSLRQLGLYRTQITDEALRSFAQLPNLSSLDLYQTKVTDEGMAHLMRIEGLRSLRFSRCNVTDRGLAFISAMQRLESLDFNQTHASDAGLAYLAHLPNLRELHMGDNPFTDAGIAHLVRLPKLESLWLSGRFSDSALTSIGTMRSLKSLKIRDGDFTAGALNRLADLPQLEELQIETDAVQATGEGVASLAKIQSLKRLEIFDFQMTRYDLGALAMLPSLEHLSVTCPPALADLEVLTNYVSLRSLRYVYPSRLDDPPRSLTPMKGLTQLENLSLPGIPFEAEEFAHLGNLTNLTKMEYDGGITDEGIRHLTGLRSLRELYFQDARLTDEGVRYLSQLENLEWLDVGGEITDTGLTYLSKLKSLRALYLSTETISQGELQRLKERLPRLWRLWTPLDRYYIGQSDDISLAGLSAPDFEVETLDGKKFRLSEHRGKAVVVYFWATWCGPCVRSTDARKEIQQKLAARFGDRFVMISLSRDEDEKKLRQHLQRSEESWVQARIGLRSKIADDYRARGAGYFFVVAPDGRVISADAELSEIPQAVEMALMPK